ncbi:MAG: hypothetical protein AB1921_18560 [Thermodesulfobacteriota bacterium]
MPQAAGNSLGRGLTGNTRIAMVRRKNPLAGLRKNTCVWITVHLPLDPEKKPDTRKSKIIDVVSGALVAEQTEPPLSRDSLGGVLCLSWLELGEDGRVSRRMLDAELVRAGEILLEGKPTDALVFDRPIRIYSGSLRRGHRVAVPREAEGWVVLLDQQNRKIGIADKYPLVDLSLAGLRFSCTRTREIMDTHEPDPAANLSLSDTVRLGLFLFGNRLMVLDAIVRTKLFPQGPDGNLVHFGMEIVARLKKDQQTEAVVRLPFTEKEARLLTPYFTRLQRMAQMKDAGI